MPTLPPVQVQNKYQAMSALLRKILSQLEPPYTTMPVEYDNLEWISARLVELLPMPFSYKQEMLEYDDVIWRIEQLYSLIRQSEVG
jgi:Lon protease-like protein